MELNPENIYAFLIAVENYDQDQTLHKLPHSRKNVNALVEAFRDSSIDIPEKNISTEYDPTNYTDLLKKLRGYVNKEDAKTLIIYYAGHGIVDDESMHYLSMTSSTVKSIDIDGLEISKLCKTFDTNKNLNIVLILDSCFSENAFNEFTARNFLIIASSAKNKSSEFRVGEDFSAFTNELITIFKDGIENGNEYLIWKDVYKQIEIDLVEKNLPIPKISVQNQVDEQPIGRNNFYKVSFDAEWVTVIKEDIASNNDKFKDKVDFILDEGKQIKNRLSDLLVRHLPFPIAYYLKKIFETKATSKSYTNLYESIIRFLLMVGFIDYERLKLTAEFKSVDKFRKKEGYFDKPDHDFCFSMLEAISTDFSDNKSNRFLEEFNYFDPGFQSVIQNLELQMKQEEKDIEALRSNIIKLISRLGFLLNYKLISVKDIKLSYRKYDPLLYKHQISMLHGNEPADYVLLGKADEDWQKSFIMDPTAKNCQSVLIVKCKHPEKIEYLNLWPMIIDKNVLDQKAPAPKIYLYAGKDVEGNYRYRDITDMEENRTTSYNDVENNERNTAFLKEKIRELFKNEP